MNKFLALGLLNFAFSTALCADDLKLGVVDMTQVLSKMSEVKDGTSEMDQNLQRYQSSLREKERKIKELSTEASELKADKAAADEAKKPFESSKQKRLTEIDLEINIQTESLRTSAKLYGDDMKSQAEDLVRRSQVSIKKAVEEIRVRDKYRIIFDENSAGILSAENMDDLTNEVLALVNEKYAASKNKK